ncbi:uncharacterized protein BDZ83DRAFT_430938 [Colletotrichum acutatum]|uniref:Secreted protein n=1 Tax=Glomerella acutata TaxID=27357 RepID=A0AAD8UFX0_GLOAC|nr:uncharacterized protein BDZ83DRAFT_430938 [Colletotrichum acutatum]KAK1722328.1 hypothetical protein BDZ83DRAFT_430938 [Colletotrichum acutatum]
MTATMNLVSLGHSLLLAHLMACVRVVSDRLHVRRRHVPCLKLGSHAARKARQGSLELDDGLALFSSVALLVFFNIWLPSPPPVVSLRCLSLPVTFCSSCHGAPHRCRLLSARPCSRLGWRVMGEEVPSSVVCSIRSGSQGMVQGPAVGSP